METGGAAHTTSLYFVCEWLMSSGYHNAVAALLEEAEQVGCPVDNVKNSPLFKIARAIQFIYVTAETESEITRDTVEHFIAMVPQELQHDEVFSHILQEILWQILLQVMKQDGELNWKSALQQVMCSDLGVASVMDPVFHESFRKDATMMLKVKPVEERHSLAETSSNLHSLKTLRLALAATVSDVKNFYGMPALAFANIQHHQQPIDRLSYAIPATIADAKLVATELEIDEAWRGDSESIRQFLQNGLSSAQQRVPQAPRTAPKNGTAVASSSSAHVSDQVQNARAKLLSKPGSTDEARLSKKRKAEVLGANHAGKTELEAEDDHQDEDGVIATLGKRIRAGPDPAKAKRSKHHEDDDDSIFDSPIARHAPAGKGSRYAGEKKARRFWTDEETTLLLKAVKRFGEGSWSSMLEWCTRRDPNGFSDRSSTDLRDRLRVVQRQQERGH